MSRPRLSEDGPTIVGNHEEALGAANRFREGTPKLRFRTPIGVDSLDRCPVALGQTSDFREGKPFGRGHLERFATNQQLFTEPSPGPLPNAARVDLERVEDRDEGPQAAPGRVGLGVQVRDEGKKRLGGSVGKRFGQQCAPFGSAERDEIGW